MDRVTKGLFIATSINVFCIVVNGLLDSLYFHDGALHAGTAMLIGYVVQGVLTIVGMIYAIVQTFRKKA